MHAVLASSNLLHDFSTVVLLIIAEFDSIKASDLHVTGKGLGILRNFRFFSTVKLQIKLFNIGHLSQE